MNHSKENIDINYYFLCHSESVFKTGIIILSKSRCTTFVKLTIWWLKKKIETTECTPFFSYAMRKWDICQMWPECDITYDIC